MEVAGFAASSQSGYKIKTILGDKTLNLVGRYKAGKYEEVWKELILLGEEVRKPDILPLAQEIARNAMIVVRRNVEELIKRWQAKDFAFGYDWAGKWAEKLIVDEPPQLAKPAYKEIELLDNFEKEFGPLPIVLRAFYEIIGAVNFVGKPKSSTYPWPEPDKQLFDPLFVYGFKIDKFMDEEIRIYSTTQIALFPDHLCKFFYSGVGAITTTIPSKDFDATLVFEGEPLHYKGKRLCFGDYLREIILSYGGIGLEGTYSDEIFVKSLCNGLKKF